MRNSKKRDPYQGKTRKELLILRNKKIFGFFLGSILLINLAFVVWPFINPRYVTGYGTVIDGWGGKSQIYCDDGKTYRLYPDNNLDYPEGTRIFFMGYHGPQLLILGGYPHLYLTHVEIVNEIQIPVVLISTNLFISIVILVIVILLYLLITYLELKLISRFKDNSHTRSYMQKATLNQRNKIGRFTPPYLLDQHDYYKRVNDI